MNDELMRTSDQCFVKENQEQKEVFIHQRRWRSYKARADQQNPLEVPVWGWVAHGPSCWGWDWGGVGKTLANREAGPSRRETGLRTIN